MDGAWEPSHRGGAIAAQGKWSEILSLPGTGPPPGARGLCPEGGYEYSVAVYHYARTLALAAKAEGARSIGDMDTAVDWYSSGAVASFLRLKVRHSSLFLFCLLFLSCISMLSLADGG